MAAAGPELLSGTVTFPFTDIAGSTVLPRTRAAARWDPSAAPR